MTAPDSHLELLGGFRLVSGGNTLAVPETAAKLLALLAINERPLSRSRIAGEFWPELSEPRAFANLRATVWRLPTASRRFLYTTGTTMSVADYLQVDLHLARTVVRDLVEGARLGEPYSAHVELLSRPLLPEWDDDWLAFEQERTRQLHIHALESLGRHFLNTGDAFSAVDVGIAVVGAEPLRESGHVLLMSAHLANGNRADARHCFIRYRDLMRHELNLEPVINWAELVAATPSRRFREVRPPPVDDAAMMAP